MTPDDETRIEDITEDARNLMALHSNSRGAPLSSHCDSCSRRWPCDGQLRGQDVLWLIDQLREAQVKLLEAEALNRDINWTSSERRRERAAAEAKSAERRDALLKVEWITSERQWPRRICVGCGAKKPAKHEPDCYIAKALEDLVI